MNAPIVLQDIFLMAINARLLAQMAIGVTNKIILANSAISPAKHATDLNQLNV
jgi:hypothetical protein